MKKKAIPCHKAGRITSFFLLISIFLLIPSITTPVYAVELIPSKLFLRFTQLIKQ